MNFYKKHIGAYAKKTPHLTLMEHGAYNLLMDACYSTEEPLPADKQSLHKICRATTTAERKAVDSVADRFFPVNGDGFRHNPRCDEELATYHSQCITNRDTAIAREEARRKHKQSTKRATNDPTNRTPNSEFRIQKELKSKSLSADAEGAFAKFWSAYPRHTDGQGALKSWKKLNPDGELLDIILAALGVQKQSEQWRRGVIPHAATWLNRRRWEDEIGSNQKDTTCQRILSGANEKCGMPGRPHPVYGYSCEHCDRKESEQRQSHEISAEVREQLRKAIK